MYEECPADLRMTQVILQNGLFDDMVHHCKVICYHSEEELLYLLAGKNELASFSLDGIYECAITLGTEKIKCSGNICERYWSKTGKVVVLRVKNGFYKNNLN